ncbi:MAG: hypothetical protein AAF846_24245 [Chloroflexota bacterium]
MPMLDKMIVCCLTSLLLVGCSGINSDSDVTISETVSLNWILGEDELLAYATTMESIQDADAQSDTETLLTMDEGSLSDLLPDIPIPASNAYTSILNLNEQGNINIRMILDEVTYAEEDEELADENPFTSLLGQMEGTVQLRGVVQPDGAIASFYNQSRQRNLVAMFFELPTSPVQIGDTWQLDFNCISMGLGFIPDTADKINEVTLTDITQTAEGERVAVIDYRLIETVEGIMDPSFALSDDSEEIPVSMECYYIARGHFLIDEGRWQQLIGEFAVISDGGFMTSSNVQRVALMPLADFPDEYRDLP